MRRVWVAAIVMVGVMANAAAAQDVAQAETAVGPKGEENGDQEEHGRAGPRQEPREADGPVECLQDQSQGQDESQPRRRRSYRRAGRP